VLLQYLDTHQTKLEQGRTPCSDFAANSAHQAGVFPYINSASSHITRHARLRIYAANKFEDQKESMKPNTVVVIHTYL